MKKIIAIAALGVFTLASCKKDYTCECTSTVFGISSTVSSTIKNTKKKAEEACTAGSTTANGATTTCKIK
jgi:hypothetical protein